jgi:hypothetical protein
MKGLRFLQRIGATNLPDSVIDEVEAPSTSATRLEVRTRQDVEDLIERGRAAVNRQRSGESGIPDILRPRQENTVGDPGSVPDERVTEQHITSEIGELIDRLVEQKVRQVLHDEYRIHP